MAKDLCEHCGIEAERTGKLDIAARCYGGFLCDPCLAGYEAIIHEGVPVAPKSAIDNLMRDAAAYGEHRGSRPSMDPSFLSALDKVPEDAAREKKGC